MAEAIGRHVAGDRFEFHSAGSAPAGFIHPLTLATLDSMGVPADGLESKSWYEFADEHVDVVVTLCDSAAQEDCPVFPGDGVRVHWLLPDPSFYPGTDGDRKALALHIARRLKLKISRMAALDFDRLTSQQLERELKKLAEL